MACPRLLFPVVRPGALWFSWSGLLSPPSCPLSVRPLLRLVVVCPPSGFPTRVGRWMVALPLFGCPLLLCCAAFVCAGPPSDRRAVPSRFCPLPACCPCLSSCLVPLLTCSRIWAHISSTCAILGSAVRPGTVESLMAPPVMHDWCAASTVDSRRSSCRTIHSGSRRSWTGFSNLANQNGERGTHQGSSDTQQQRRTARTPSVSTWLDFPGWLLQRTRQDTCAITAVYAGRLRRDDLSHPHRSPYRQHLDALLQFLGTLTLHS